MKVIPMYLPQFHVIPENNEWWGEGFTEWTNVKKAKPMFNGHYQPRIPLNKNYYDLTDVKSIKWQCKIARDHGIYGFCFYHYWFNGKLLLEKPMEILLAHPEIDIKYCISWANHNWEDAWKSSNKEPKILIGHDFDNEDDWTDHFNYLLKFFKDSRYMVEKNKPVLVIYIPNIIGKLNKMLSLWNNMAIENGFDGLTFMFQSAMSYHSKGWNRTLFDYGIEFNPGFVNSKKSIVFDFNLMKYSHILKNFFGIKNRLFKDRKQIKIFDYDSTWQKILELKPSADNAIPSAFVDWDNTPRVQNRGSLYNGASPEKFKIYFKRLIQKTKNEYKCDKIFVFAWNEWAEGGYLEPDEKYNFGYLEAIYESLDETNELNND